VSELQSGSAINANAWEANDRGFNLKIDELREGKAVTPDRYPAAPRPELILHAGAHKTGTTAIQAFAHRNRDALLQRSILYPKFAGKGDRGHHVFAHAVAGQAKFGSLPKVKKQVRIWKDAADSSKSRLFVSAEPIFRHRAKKAETDWPEQRRQYLMRLAEILAEFQVNVVIVLRRQDTFIRSLYQEHVMRATVAGALSFAGFRERQPDIIRYRENLAVFEEVFSRPKVLVYEDFPRGDRFCEFFFSAIGVDVSGLPAVGIVRESLSVAETTLKRFINPYITSAKENRAVLGWLRDRTTQDLLRTHCSEGGELWESQEERAKFLARFQPDNDWLLDRYFKNRARLFPPLEKKEDCQPAMETSGLIRALMSNLKPDPQLPMPVLKMCELLRSGLK
jgi:hypothetical protein